MTTELEHLRELLSQSETREKTLRSQLCDAVYALEKLQKQYDMQAVFHHRKERSMRGPLRFTSSETCFIPFPVDERTIKPFAGEEYVDCSSLHAKYVKGMERTIQHTLAQRAVDFLLKEAAVTVAADTADGLPIKRFTMKLWVILPEKQP